MDLRVGFRLSAVAASYLLANVAHTQTLVTETGVAKLANAATGSPPTPDQANDEIIVTATRREQSLQNVPIAINAVTSDSLAKARISSTSDLAKLVPNLNITSQEGAFIVFLRGVGQLAINPGQEPSVATYVDGVYQPTVFGSLTNLTNIERVEVIKGPQGTLFGRNATGGLINVITRDPSQVFGGNMSFSYGAYDTFRTSGYVTTGLGDKIAADFGYYLNDQARGYGVNETTGKRETGTRNLALRSKILFEPTDATKVRLTGAYAHNRSAIGPDLAVLQGSVAFDGTTAPKKFYDITANFEPLSRNTTWQTSARIDQEFDLFSFISITAYTRTRSFDRSDDDGTPTPLINSVITQRFHALTQELQLVSKKGSPLTWIFGAFYYHSIGTGAPTGTGLYGLAFNGGGIQERAKLKTDSIAAYGEGTYELLPKLDVTVGARYTRDRKELSGNVDITDINGNPLSTTPINPEKKTFTKPTYRTLLDYHITPQIMGYVSYSRGFKSGGYDTSYPTGIAFRPEVLDAFEGGFKTELFDRRLRLNMAGFYYNYRNLQLDVLTGAGAAQTQITINAASAKVDGADIDGSYKITRNANLNFGLGYLSSHFTKFPDAPCTRRGPGGAIERYVCDVSGNSTGHAPELTYNIGGSYRIPVSIGVFTLSGTYSYMSRFFFNPDDRLSQSGYGLLNAQLGWNSVSERLGISAFVENLTARQYTIAQYAQAGIADNYVAGSPRTFGLEARLKF